MSKAFTRESDESPEPSLRRTTTALPSGAKNYLTPDGAQRMRDELKRLVEVDRVQLISSGVTTSDERIKALDQRIFHLNNNLQSAVIVPPPETSDEPVRFGATVTVRERTGEETRYRIVGIDEADIDRGWISWLSPLAKKLINTRPGDRVHLSSSGATNELEILAVTYE